jgi:hypothetical protein
VGTTALYTFSSGVTQAFVTVTATTCPGQSAISNSGTPPPPPPLNGFITGDNLLCNYGQQLTREYFLTTTQCSNPITWGSDDPNVVINPGASSGTFSNATFTFPSNGFFSVFATIKGFSPIPLRVDLSGGVEVVSSSDPRCDIFQIKSPTGTMGNTLSLKARNTTKGSATLFPNPVSEVLRLDQLQDYNNLRVVDQYGKVLSAQVIGEGETQKSLNVSQFANGLYLIQFTNKTGELTTKKFQVMH